MFNNSKPPKKIWRKKYPDINYGELEPFNDLFSQQQKSNYENEIKLALSENEGA